MDGSIDRAQGGEDPWRVVSDAVLRGLNHAISNRVTALATVSALLTPDECPGPELTQMLADEVGRMEGVLRLLRLLPAGLTAAAPHPVLLADALADALALHAHHAGLDDRLCAVEGDAAALPPVVAPPLALTHALVLLLGAVAVHARASGARGTVQLAGDARTVRVAGALGGAPGDAGQAGGVLEPGAVAGALRRMLAGADVDVSVDGSLGVARVELVLPTLAVRRTPV